jgi:FlaA1/EpsC-like NDP-sugar epimerase
MAIRYKHVVVDGLLTTAGYFVALGVRLLDPRVGDGASFMGDLAVAMPIIITVHLALNVAGGAYGRVWEYASTTETKRVIAASLIAMPILLTLVLVGRGLDVVVPLSTVLLGGVMSLVGMATVRFVGRRV